MNLPKITVVTPNFNQASFLELTILSVLNQNYPNLEYIIIDGGSTDNSLDIIRKYQDDLSYWLSEKDKGVYDAINKGFSKATGEILCWINSDDILWENSLHYIGTIFSQNPNLKWLQGVPTVINEDGQVIYRRAPVSSKFYFYLKKHEQTFSFIQQESIFWRRDLWEKAGGYLDIDYKLAADFDLWLRFFEHASLYCTTKQLGAFRIRSGQKSENRHLYLKEAKISLKSNFKNLANSEIILISGLMSLSRIKRWFKCKWVDNICRKLETKAMGKTKMISLTL